MQSVQVIILLQLANVDTTTNYKLLLWLTLKVSYMDILSVKKNYLRYVHYYFWNKYCNLPFLAIYRYQFPLLIFLGSSWSKSENCTVNELANKKNLVNKKTYKRKNNYHFKGLYKTTSYKTKPNFSQFFLFTLTAVWLLFPFFL